MKNKNYLIILIITVSTVIITSFIVAIIKNVFNFELPLYQFIIGWIGASVYYIAHNKFNSKYKLTIDAENITSDMTEIDYQTKYKNLLIKYTNCKSENEKIKNELDYISTKYENLKSEIIVEKSIKI